MVGKHLEGRTGRNLSLLKSMQAGYMTVEATLILSIVFGVYLFLIGCGFWIYDRCILEQDIATLTIKCVVAEEEELENVWKQALENRDGEKYLWLEAEEPVWQRQGWKFTITGRGRDHVLSDCSVSYEVWDLNPEDWLRRKRSIKLEKEKEEAEK